MFSDSCGKALGIKEDNKYTLWTLTVSGSYWDITEHKGKSLQETLRKKLMFQFLKCIFFIIVTTFEKVVHSPLFPGANRSLWQDKRCCSIKMPTHSVGDISCRAAEIHWTPERTTRSRSYSCHTACSSTKHSSDKKNTLAEKELRPWLFYVRADMTSNIERSCIHHTAAA